jgi:peptidoglycan/xylan/chitin deacetylase (PgdA/CDA1 family)
VSVNREIRSMGLLGILALSLAYSVTVYANQDVTSVCLWKGAKDGAVSITFDDSFVEQYTKAYPELRKRGLPATFFTIAGFIGTIPDDMTLSQIQDLANNGNEIGSHTVYHSRLRIILGNYSYVQSYDQMVYEISQSKVMLEQITGKPVDSISYPGGVGDSTTWLVTSQYYIAGRLATSPRLALPDPSPISGYPYFPPLTTIYALPTVAPHDPYTNKYGIQSGGAGDANAISSLQYWADEAGNQFKWDIEMLHSIGHPGLWDNVSVTAFSTHLDYLKDNESRLWIAPMGTVAKYIYEREAAHINTTTDINSIAVDVNCYLDSRFNVPLTLITTCPNDWLTKPLAACQGQTILSASHYTKYGHNYIMYDAVPDAGTITLYPVEPNAPPLLAAGNFDNNYVIDARDLFVFSQAWCANSENPDWQLFAQYDLDLSGTVDFVDFAQFSNNWKLFSPAIPPLTVSGNAGMDGVTMSGLPGYPVTTGGGFYSAVVPYGWSGMVIPVKTGVSFDPPIMSFDNVIIEEPNQDFAAASINPVISGSASVDGVTMTGLPGNPVTSGGGLYSVVVPYGWDGTITPAKLSYRFSPASVTYTDITYDLINRNFTATQAPDCNISGSTGVDGVVMVGLPGNPVTSGGGLYSAVVPYGWGGTITPTKTNYSFSPGSVSYTYVTSDMPNRDFVTSQVMTNCIISGSAGVDGVTMNGLPGDPCTSGGGLFSVVVPYGWSGTITPVKTGYTFNPTSISYSEVTSNLANRNFVATVVNPCVISGNAGVDDVNMSGLPGPTVTSGGGLWSAVVPYGWSGTITPTKPGYIFSPASISYTEVTSDLADRDFTATAIIITIFGTTGMDSVTMTGLPGDPVTDTDGSYSVVVPYGWSGMVTPTKIGYAFSPASRSYTNITADQPDQNYPATMVSFPSGGYGFSAVSGFTCGDLGYTRAGLDHPILYNGTLTRVQARLYCVTTSVPVTLAKLKVLRLLSGTTYTVVSDVNITPQVNAAAVTRYFTLDLTDLSLPVAAGDYVGFYFSNNIYNVSVAGDGTGAIREVNGDKTTTANLSVKYNGDSTACVDMQCFIHL